MPHSTLDATFHSLIPETTMPTAYRRPCSGTAVTTKTVTRSSTTAFEDMWITTGTTISQGCPTGFAEQGGCRRRRGAWSLVHQASIAVPSQFGAAPEPQR